eukprot:CAMPEP_0181115088 /NCGR_PEP_ID=MMETSP1071-20121207/21247_1 /TAXON_ID=35127 /ORGANISM="Thalassiosira sp., Strain NH16" /LENGTH=153 /DNA_ID=CAMNT_0023199275 /DNA_START=151 /DNA_END=609 /DNA_ORIENTATION=+
MMGFAVVEFEKVGRAELVVVRECIIVRMIAPPRAAIVAVICLAQSRDGAVSQPPSPLVHQRRGPLPPRHHGRLRWWMPPVSRTVIVARGVTPFNEGRLALRIRDEEGQPRAAMIPNFVREFFVELGVHASMRLFPTIARDVVIIIVVVVTRER